MKISEVKGARKIKVWVEPIDPSDSIENKQVRIEMGSVEGVYDLICREPQKLVPVKLRDAKKETELRDLLVRRPSRLAVIGGVASDGSAELEICFFSGVLEDFGKLEIRIPKRILDSVKRSKFPVKDLDEFKERLNQELLIESGRESIYFFAYLGANAASNEFEDTDIPLEKKAKSEGDSKDKIDEGQKESGEDRFGTKTSREIHLSKTSASSASVGNPVFPLPMFVAMLMVKRP